MNVLWLRVLFAALLLGAGAYIVGTADALPAVIATQFGIGGGPVSWMSRDGYLIFMMCFAVGLPLLIVAIIAWLLRRFPDRVNIPNRNHWLAPERRDASLAFLHALFLAIACLIVAFMAGLHWLVLRSNGSGPPQLDYGLLLTLAGVFLVAEGLCMLAMVRRFGRRPGAG